MIDPWCGIEERVSTRLEDTMVHQSHLRCHVLEGRAGAGNRPPISISGWFKTETNRGAARQEYRAAVISHPALLDIEAATSICQILGVYCPFSAMNSACPTPELVFSSLDSAICLPLLQETCPPQPTFFFVPSIGVISY